MIGGGSAGRYDPRLAQRDAEAAARRPKERKLDASPRLRACVVDRLMLRWSPEQVSRRLREFFPKDTRFSEVTDEEVACAQWLLNNRPRKVLGWKFPAEVMQEVLAEGAMTA